MNILKRNRDGESGQSLVEFAVTAPIVFLFILGLFDAGRMVFINNELSQAAREGARFGAVQGRAASEADGKDTAVSDEVSSRITIAPAPTVSLSCMDLGPGGGTCRSGDLLTISVSSSVAPITPLIGDIIGSLELTSQAQMTIH